MQYQVQPLRPQSSQHHNLNSDRRKNMNLHAEARINQMAAENVEAIPWLTAPIRFVISLLNWAIFVVLFAAAVPIIFAGLVIHFIITGQAFLSDLSVAIRSHCLDLEPRLGFATVGWGTGASSPWRPM